MRVKYFMEHRSDVPHVSAESDLQCEGIDCIQLLVVSEFSSESRLAEITGLLTEREFQWWGESARLESEQGKVKIYTPASYDDEHCEITINQLKAVIRDYKSFLSDKSTLVKSY